jgi:hypothetical protein
MLAPGGSGSGMHAPGGGRGGSGSGMHAPANGGGSGGGMHAPASRSGSGTSSSMHAPADGSGSGMHPGAGSGSGMHPGAGSGSGSGQHASGSGSGQHASGSGSGQHSSGSGSGHTSGSRSPAGPMNSPGGKFAGMDRRRVFAGMKYNRPPSVREPLPPGGESAPGAPAALLAMDGMPVREKDGMPDFHMVESSLSLHSNMSIMTSGDSKPAGQNHASATSPGGAAHAAGVPSGNYDRPRVQPETAKVVDHSSMSRVRDRVLPDALSSGSRHSIMSGLSRISDTSSIDGSMFSDLSRKIGNVSTRSIAMSDISAIDMQEMDDEDTSHSELNNSGLGNNPDIGISNSNSGGLSAGFSLPNNDSGGLGTNNNLGLDQQQTTTPAIYGDYRKKATTEFDL